MRILLLFVGLLMLTACTTRQVGGTYVGSTEQRLVTYSIDKLVAQLPAEDFAGLAGKKVLLRSHFIVANQTLSYADQMIKLDLARRFQIDFVEQKEDAESEVDVFFTSLGTDNDTYGLSIPIVNLSDTSQASRIDILAVDMYHGISECLYYIKDADTQEVTRKGKILARVRTDKFATPIFSFPISNID
ncbi:hypothetical protein [Pleionea sp. CnH1-48]|uniref:hypothetical protein n=1 Tax=Pleionea sp. CnH1-48 TaxID=2954494 RepID=UPI0020976859|nr:hypothetical protein [Pleionea sp. CnH1-48]MCO7225518.1 hypothetical protein [Pleionea sp. CnH1-48]